MPKSTAEAKMEGKSENLPKSAAFHVPPKDVEAFRTRRSRTRDIIVIGLFLTVSLAVYRTATSTFRPFPLNHHCHHKHHDQPTTITYPGESISWTPCGTLGSRPLECANLTVPMDHFNTSSHNLPDSKTFTIPLLRLRSNSSTTSTGAPIPNILLNPGGPGASGTNLLHRRGAQLATILGPDFHLLGFDPRGINQSLPFASCYPDPPTRTALSRVNAKRVVEDSGELWAWSSNFAQSCADTMGEWGAYINTPQTAADMNSILDAVGQRGMYYWGFSYGTILGQTYATMFPERAERVVIDGVANQFEWYGERLDGEMWADADRVFEGFLEECIKAGKGQGEEKKGGCALAETGTTKEELREVVLGALGRLRDDPVGVYVNNTVYGVLDYWAVWFSGVFPALYKPATWGELAENLAKLIAGNATDAFMAFGREEAWGMEGEALHFVSLNDGLSGPQEWPFDRTGLLDLLLPLFNQSMFSEETYEFYFAKRAWSIPRTHSYVPQRRVKTAHPVLVLSTTYDPVCPLVSARTASDAFEGSRIVEVKGYGHCSLAVPSLCLARHVREFFQEGKLPDKDTQCEVDGKPYFSDPEEEMVGLEVQSLEDEERQVRLALLQLARDSWHVRRPL